MSTESKSMRVYELLQWLEDADPTQRVEIVVPEWDEMTQLPHSESLDLREVTYDLAAGHHGVVRLHAYAPPSA